SAVGALACASISARPPKNILRTDALQHDIADGSGNRNAKAKAAATTGGPKSLGALLALVGTALISKMEKTMDELAKAAKELDGMKDGPTAAKNQEIQKLTFDLQQV